LKASAATVLSRRGVVIPHVQWEQHQPLKSSPSTRIKRLLILAEAFSEVLANWECVLLLRPFGCGGVRPTHLIAQQRLRTARELMSVAEVRLQEGESVENALRRFKRKVQAEKTSLVK